MNTGAYDNFPFISRPSPDRHPDRFATLGQLFGLSVKNPNCAKVLELGCGTGSNLIPMALQYKDSEFIGIDLSQNQIAQAMADANALQLKNVRFLSMDLRSFEKSFGNFDYIICHGVFSWVSEEVQTAILKIFRSHLAPEGVAYMNFNARPGWDIRGALHKCIQSSVKATEMPQKIEEAKAILRSIEQTQIDDQSHYGNNLRRELEHLQKQSDAFIASELLNPDSCALYFSDFIELVSNYDLQYLSDVKSHRVQLCTPQELSLPNAIWPLFTSMDVVQKEQLFETMYPRSLRSCLLCKKNAAVKRAIAPEILETLHVASPLLPPPDLLSLQSNDAVEFQNAHGPVLEVSAPLLKAALSLLGSMWPLPIDFSDLCRLSRQRLEANAELEIMRQDDREALSSALLSYFSVGLVELSHGTPVFSVTPVEKPLAHPFARHQSKTQNWLINYRHEFVILESVERQLLRLMSGTHARAELVSEMINLYHKGDIVGLTGASIPSSPKELKEMFEALYDECINKFHRLALISA